MICEHCKQRHASVTVTQVMNGHKSERHYCDVCAAQFHPFNLDFHKDEQIPIHQLVSNWFGIPNFQTSTGQKSAESSQQTTNCPGCGFTFRQFLNEGKLGCPQCYETFSQQLPRVLKKIQAGSKHIGKEPGKLSNNNEWVKKQITTVREKLQSAIVDERFEEAAKLRDEIKELERKLEIGGVDTP